MHGDGLVAAPCGGRGRATEGQTRMAHGWREDGAHPLSHCQQTMVPVGGKTLDPKRSALEDALREGEGKPYWGVSVSEIYSVYGSFSPTCWPLPPSLQRTSVLPHTQATSSMLQNNTWEPLYPNAARRFADISRCLCINSSACRSSPLADLHLQLGSQCSCPAASAMLLLSV